jgi:hypothetical protein
MTTTQGQLEITDLPAYVQSWSVVNLPGFITKLLASWQRNYGALPDTFSLIACPQAEINANGGLPSPVIALTDARVRIKQFTSCHRLYLVILIMGEQVAIRRQQIQQYLSWSEAYDVVRDDGVLRLRFIEAVEESDCD